MMRSAADVTSREKHIQFPLGIALSDSARFDNFYAGPNQELVQTLNRCVAGSEHGPVYFWGGTGSGKTHLLQALCREAGSKGRSVAYLPLARSTEIEPGILDGLENLDLVCLDDIQVVAGLPQWEEALFDLFNRLQEQGAVFLAAADSAPSELGVQLNDLVSRLGWGLVYPIADLQDKGRLEVLQMRACGRGLELPTETGRYLLNRYPRDLPTLCALFDRLDQASLVAQRRLTIPFVKSVLGSE